jgi:hypothetical protein
VTASDSRAQHFNPLSQVELLGCNGSSPRPTSSTGSSLEPSSHCQRGARFRAGGFCLDLASAIADETDTNRAMTFFRSAPPRIFLKHRYQDMAAWQFPVGPASPVAADDGEVVPYTG